MKPKFKFYEVVMVRGEPSTPRELAGPEGVILGMAQRDDANWNYAVHLLGTGRSTCFDEKELEATGRFKRREDIYPGDSVNVLVFPATGRASAAGAPKRKRRPRH